MNEKFIFTSVSFRFPYLVGSASKARVSSSKVKYAYPAAKLLVLHVNIMPEQHEPIKELRRCVLCMSCQVVEHVVSERKQRKDFRTLFLI